MRQSHADLMWFDGREDDTYEALRDWISLVLNPAVVNDNSGRFLLEPEYLESLADG